jgi:hypothetical protein
LGYPRAFKVEVSEDGSTWRQVAAGRGSGAATVVTVQPASARFVRIVLTEGDGNNPAWTIQDLRVFALRK